MDNEPAYAKVNLALHVRRRRPDGYHDLETVFAFCEQGDMLFVEASADLSLSISGLFGDGLSAGQDNLILRAAEALRRAAGIRAGAALRLDKRLPVAAGIGGGSADAAAALRLLKRLWAVDLSQDQFDAIARDLGADVPACLVSRLCRGEGRGDRLNVMDGAPLTGLPILLVNPRVAMPTGPVFRAWDGVDRGGLAIGDPLAAAASGRNDLEPPAVAIEPVIGTVIETLFAMRNVRLARMSGSGATCFALFENAHARDVADDAIASAYPNWWRLSTSLR